MKIAPFHTHTQPKAIRNSRESANGAGKAGHWRDGKVDRRDGGSWLGENGSQFALLFAVDDATGTVINALFCQQQDSLSYFRLLQGLVQRQSIPVGLYTNRLPIFKHRSEYQPTGTIAPPSGPPGPADSPATVPEPLRATTDEAMDYASAIDDEDVAAMTVYASPWMQIVLQRERWKAVQKKIEPFFRVRSGCGGNKGRVAGQHCGQPQCNYDVTIIAITTVSSNRSSWPNSLRL